MHGNKRATLVNYTTHKHTYGKQFCGQLVIENIIETAVSQSEGLK